MFLKKYRFVYVGEAGLSVISLGCWGFSEFQLCISSWTENKMDALGSLICSFHINNLGRTQVFNLSCKDIFSLVDRWGVEGYRVIVRSSTHPASALGNIYSCNLYMYPNPKLGKSWRASALQRLVYLFHFNFRVSICLLYVVIHFVLPLTCAHGGIYPNK